MNPQESELVLNDDGSVYHLKLLPKHIAPNVILVGDPGRVSVISSMFDTIEYQISNREFVTHTGTYKGTKITALATGIGTDNIDIVVNELDAAVNFDLETRRVKTELQQLNLIRLGTCGALQKELEVNSTVITEYSIGMDGVKHFYDIKETDAERHVRIAFEGFTEFDDSINKPYASQSDLDLFNKFAHLGKAGCTLTANGFFGPQGRSLRLPLSLPTFNDDIERFEVSDRQVLNYEMESSALYALGKALGHKCLCMCIVVANRKAMQFSKDYHPAMKQLIKNVLEGLSN